MGLRLAGISIDMTNILQYTIAITSLVISLRFRK